jgi:predicted DCC family thiol-disulfide oxidoreductase YuxK
MAWTGGQYSLFRFGFGLFLAVGFAGVAPAAIPAPPLLRALGIGLAVAAAVGWHDRVAAAGAALLVAANPDSRFEPPSALPILFAILVLQTALPPAPYGSLQARGRTDLAGDWRFPAALHVACWAGLCLSAGYLAVAALHRAAPAVVVALGLGALSWPARLRPWIWAALMLGGLTLLWVPGFAGFGGALLFLLWISFNPAWVPPRPAAAQPSLVFYDGACGFCHASVRFFLAEDVSGKAFRFAPLGGPTAAQALPADLRTERPGTIVVRTPDGSRLTKAAAVEHVASRLGGTWRVGARLLGWLPRAWTDAGYDVVAAMRDRLAPRPSQACPLVSPALLRRFDP